MPAKLTPNELRIVLLMASVQFVNVLDFMMVMPLGPDFAKALGVPMSHIGYVGGSYVAAACIAGLVSSLFLDRLDRRTALAFCMAGLGVATLSGAFAVDFTTLIAARVLAGIFGGPATALALAIVTDNVAVQRRGRGVGIVMASFSVASVLGLPLGLELARWSNWQAPFYAVAGLGLVIVMVALRILKPQRAHLKKTDAARDPPLHHMLAIARRPLCQLAYVLTSTTFISGFMLFPNMSSYLQMNLGFPREDLGLLFMAGGALSFVFVPLAGRLIDRIGSTPLTLAASLCFSGLILLVVYPPAWLPILVLFPLFMVTNAMRMVSQSTLMTKIPAQNERAAFMALLSAVQHFASASGAFLSSAILVTHADGSLGQMPVVGMVAIALVLAGPPLMWLLEKRVKSRVVRDQGSGISDQNKEALFADP